jgi:hypothetical protein
MKKQTELTETTVIKDFDMDDVTAAISAYLVSKFKLVVAPKAILITLSNDRLTVQFPPIVKVKQNKKSKDKVTDKTIVPPIPVVY